MATKNIEFGIEINIGGNAARAGNEVADALSNAGRAAQGLGHAAQGSLGDLLALQSSLFVLTKFGAEFQQFGVNVVSGIVGAFNQALNVTGEFQQAMSFLKLYTKDQFDTARESVLRLAEQTSLSTTDVTNLAQRLLSLGLSVDQVFKPIKGLNATLITNLAAGITRLSGQEMTRALNSVANILTDVNSLERLLNIGVPRAFKDAFSTARTEVEKTAIIATILDQNFSKIFAPGGILDNYIPARAMAFQEFQTILSEALMPAVEALGKVFRKFAEQLAKLRQDKQFMEALRQVMSDLVKMFLAGVKALMLMTQWISEFIKKHPDFARYAITGALLFGVLTAIIGTLILAASSVTLLALALWKLNVAIIANTGATSTWSAAMQIATVSAKGLFVALGWIGAIAFTLYTLFEAFDALPNFMEAWGQGAKILGVALGTILNVIKVISSIISGIIGGILGFFVGGPWGAALGAAAGWSGTFALWEKMIPSKEVVATGTPTMASIPQNPIVQTGAAEFEGAKAAAWNSNVDTLARAIAPALANKEINLNVNAEVDDGVLFKVMERMTKEEQEKYTISAMDRLY